MAASVISTNLNDVGLKSGTVHCGIVKIYDRDKQNFVSLEINTDGDLIVRNKAGEYSIVTLTATG